MFEERGWALTYADVAATLAVILAVVALILTLMSPGGAPTGGVIDEGDESLGKVKGATRIDFLANTSVLDGKPILKMAGMKLLAFCTITKAAGGIWTAIEHVQAISKDDSTVNALFVTDDGNSEAPHVRGAAIAAGQPFSIFQGDGPPFLSATGGSATQAEGQVIVVGAKETVTVNFHGFVQTKPDGGACEFNGTAVSAN